MKEAGRGRLFGRKGRGWPCLATDLFLSDAQDLGEPLCIQGEYDMETVNRKQVRNSVFHE